MGSEHDESTTTQNLPEKKGNNVKKKIESMKKPARKRATLTHKTRSLKKRTRTGTKALKSKLWALVSKFVRLKDATPEGLNVCYTCGEPKFWKELQAGHGISGRGNAILFEIAIIKPQCYQCNIRKHGNYEVFVPKLCREIGLEAYENFVIMSKKPRKLTKEWYEGEIAYYQSWIDEFLVRDSGI